MTVTPSPSFPRRSIVLILLIAFTLRLAWGFFILHRQGGDFIFNALPDSAGYTMLARSFLGLPVAADVAYKLPHFSFWRTPGQPLYLAAALSCGPLAASVLILMNALAGALAAGIVFGVGRQLSPSHPGPARLAGAMAALSPTGISLTATGLTEVTFQAAVWGAFYLLIAGAGRADDRRLWWSGVALAVAAVFRPSAQFLPWLWPVVAWLLARHFGVAPRWKTAALAALVPLLFIGAWTARNGIVHGVYTYSGIGPYDLDRYVGIRVFRSVHPELSREEAEKRYGMDWSGSDKRSIWQGHTPAEAYRFHQERVNRLLHEHPVRFPLTMLAIAGDNLLEYAKLPIDQVPELEGARAGWRAVYKWVLRILLLFDLVAVGVLLRRGRWPVALLLVGCVAYFLALSGVLYFQGSRLSYPASPALWVLAGMGLSKDRGKEEPRG